MIHINLLAGPRARKVKGQWDVHTEVAVAATLVTIVLSGCLYYAWSLEDEIETKRFEQQQKQTQIAVLKEKLKKVEDFEQKKKLLETKNKVIEELEKRRGGPVRLLDVVSQSLDPLKLWLLKLTVNGDNIELLGQALENDDVVVFVNNLRQNGHFANIHLAEIRAKELHRTKIFEFKLTMQSKG